MDRPDIALVPDPTTGEPELAPNPFLPDTLTQLAATRKYAQLLEAEMLVRKYQQEIVRLDGVYKQLADEYNGLLNRVPLPAVPEGKQYTPQMDLTTGLQFHLVDKGAG